MGWGWGKSLMDMGWGWGKSQMCMGKRSDWYGWGWGQKFPTFDTPSLEDIYMDSTLKKSTAKKSYRRNPLAKN